MVVRVVAMATKFRPKNCTYQFSARNLAIYCMYSGDFGAGEFQYAIRIFKGAKGVAMATKFEQKKQYCTDFSCLQEIEEFLREKSGFSVGNFKYAISIFKETKGVAMATKFEQKISQTCTDFSSVQEIEELFASKVRISGWRIQICYPNFQGNQGSCYGNQIGTKISQNCTDFSPLQEIEEFFA